MDDKVRATKETWQAVRTVRVRVMMGGMTPAARDAPYGARCRFGPWHRQTVRFVGRALERLGAWLDSWSWGWTR